MKIRTLFLSCTAAAVLTAAPAWAQDNGTETPTWAFDLAFGAAFTSDYVSRGTSQSGGPAVQGYVEASYGIVYAGVWASSVSPAITGGNVEIDVYGGIRPEFGNLSLDLGYAHYFYSPGGACCGEVYAKANYAFTENFSGGAEIYQDFVNNTTWAAAGTEIGGLPLDLAFSAKVGSDFGTLALGVTKVAWDAGVSRTFADAVTLDLRYHDSNVDPARFVATLSVDTSLSALKKMFNN